MNSLTDDLQRREAAGLYRSRLVAETPAGPEQVIDGQRLVSFCSNDYLGLANDIDVNRAFQRGIDRWGSGSGAAHLINGHSAAHHALEEELAEFTGRQRALLFSTGYMANQGVAVALTGRGDAVFEDRLNHASLLDAGLLSGARFHRYRHADMDDLERKLAARETGGKLVMTDGVFSMDGDIAPLKALAKTADKHGAWLMVDDAHGLGVLGPGGRGTLAELGLDQRQVPVLMGTLGKAFGTFGAFVAGEAALIETLIQKARSYIYTTALPSAVAEATRTSLRIAREQDWRRAHLAELVQRFKAFAGQLGLPLMPSDTAIQPIRVGETQKAVALSRSLREQGILVTAIRPPTVPEGTARLRLTFSAAHSEKHLQQLLAALENAFQSAA